MPRGLMAPYKIFSAFPDFFVQPSTNASLIALKIPFLIVGKLYAFGFFGLFLAF